MKGLLREGTTVSSGLWGKHKYMVALETNTSPVEGAGAREHGYVTDPTLAWALPGTVVSTGSGSKRIIVGHTELGGK